MMKRLFLFFMISFAGMTAVSAKDFLLKSPDGRVEVTVSVEDSIRFSINYSSERILLPSAVALDVEGKVLSVPKVKKATLSSADRILEAVVPMKSRKVRDCFNELKLDLRGGWAAVFRAYDNGVAYRFETSWRDSIKVTDEVADYRFAEDCSLYWANETSREFISHCEAFFKEIRISEIQREKYSYLPVSILTPSGTRVVVTETDLHDYPNLFLFGGRGTALEAVFPRVILDTELRTDRDVNVLRKAPYIASTSGSRTFPWRIFTLGDDRSLLENNLPWQLASEAVPGDKDWIRPGKISWEWWAALNVYGVDFKAGVNTDTYRYYIDFAAEKGLEYILMDEGWSASTMDILNPKPDLNLHELIEYGKSKGVGIVLWTLWTPMMADMETILDTYRDWGISGIKIDFMQMNDQNMVNFYEDVARECFERKLIVDFHGSFKPSGLHRKYPNVMSYEGVYGMEHDKCSMDISPDHDLVLPFTRMVAGPMDYTPGAVINATEEDFSIRWNHPMSQGTRAHQAAIFIAFESGVQMLCDTPSNYRRAPEFADFIASVPTVWDEMRAIQAKAGDYLLIARRSGDTWLVSGLTDWNARTLTLPLDFLDGGDAGGAQGADGIGIAKNLRKASKGKFIAKIFRDGVNADTWAEDYVLETVPVTPSDTLEVRMAPGGGWAAIISAAPPVHEATGGQCCVSD